MWVSLRKPAPPDHSQHGAASPINTAFVIHLIWVQPMCKARYQMELFDEIVLPYYDKVPKAINFRDLAQNINSGLLNQKTPYHAV